MATSKMADTIKKSKFLVKINKQLVKVLGPESKTSFQTFGNTLFVRGLRGTTIFVSLKTDGRSYPKAKSCFNHR